MKNKDVEILMQGIRDFMDHHQGDWKKVVDRGSIKNPANLPVVVAESTIILHGITVRVYLLDNGKRVVHNDDVNALLEKINE